MKTIVPKPRYKIEQIRIDDMDGVRRWTLDRFAREFGHEIEPVFPIFIVFVDGEIVAYYYAQPQVIIYPAVHPEKVSPRMFFEVGTVLVAALKQSFGNPLWTVEEGSPVDEYFKVNPVMLKKMRLTRTILRVYETDE